MLAMSARSPSLMTLDGLRRRQTTRPSISGTQLQASSATALRAIPGASTRLFSQPIAVGSYQALWMVPSRPGIWPEENSTRTLSGNATEIWAVDVSQNDRWIAAGGGTRIPIWDFVTGVLIRELIGHAGAVTAIAFSPDSRFLASGAMDTMVKIWAPATGSCIQTFSGHTSRVTSVIYSKDCRRLASGAWI